MSTLILLVLAAVLGFLVGGMVNAFVMRTRESLMFTTARSCAVCAEPASASEYLPIFGYFAVKGRCGRCRAIIPWQYPATELAIALLFVIFAARALSLWGLELPEFVAANETLWLFVRDAAIASLLVIVFVFDYRASIIPDRITIPAMVLAIIFNLWLGLPVISIFLGGLLLGSFFAVQFLVSNGRWVGGGDIRLGMLIGFLLGPWIGLATLLVAYVVGAIAGLVLIASGRRKLQSHVPFGTFMAAATVLAMLFGEWAVEWYLGFLN